MNLGTGRGWRELPSTPRRGAKWNLDGKPFGRDAIPPAEAQFLLPTTLPARMANPVRTAGGGLGLELEKAWRLAGAASSVLANPSHRLGGTWAGPVPRKIRIALSRHLTHCRTAPPVVVKKGGKAVGSAARRLPCSTQVPYRVPYSSAIRIWNGRARTQQSYKVLFQTLTRSGPLQRFDMHVGSNRGPSAASRKRTTLTLFPNIGRICLS